MNEIATVRPKKRVVSVLLTTLKINLAHLFAILAFGLTGCTIISPHQFAEPANQWQVRTGQLMYRSANTRLIGDAIVRFTKNGDFELTFSKGPGLPLLVLRQDMQFATIGGALARSGWSGPIVNAPKPLRSWLGLRDAILRAPNQKTIRYSTGQQSFLIRL